ncbi:MAG TPA: putative DNA-binding domain-containing protein, partial [Burkholderiaceae bacterium]
MSANTIEREAMRQRQLLRALWQRGDDSALTPWLSEAGARAAQGLDAYRGNAAAIAERALASVFPTVQQLLGEESF